MIRSDHLVTIAPRIPAMLRPATKVLLTIEVVICFAPVALMLLLGLVVAPVQIVQAVDDPLNWRSAISIIGEVACGVIGLATLVLVLGKLFLGRTTINNPMLVCIGAALGALPLLPAFGAGVGALRLAGLLPLAVSAHILFLARRMLFSPWRDGLKRAVMAAVVALSMLAVPLLDPSRASNSRIREQQAIWSQRAPERYEFTVQLSGDAPVEALIPKRIWVEHGKVTSTKYVWDDENHRAGDPAPMEDLWTIDRAFTELLKAEAQGWNVRVRFNKDSGFVEKAEAIKNDGTNTVWVLENRDFSVTTAAAREPRPVYVVRISSESQCRLEGLIVECDKLGVSIVQYYPDANVEVKMCASKRATSASVASAMGSLQAVKVPHVEYVEMDPATGKNCSDGA